MGFNAHWKDRMLVILEAKIGATPIMDLEHIAYAQATKKAMWNWNFINEFCVAGVHSDINSLPFNTPPPHSNSSQKITVNL